MSYENRKKEYERLVNEAKGLKKKDKYHKIPEVLIKEFGDPSVPVEEAVEEIA